ncbi:MAG: nickel-binding protein [Pseudomonadota bacterium]
MANLKRYVIERDIAGVGGMSIVELCGAARASNCALEKLGGTVQWQHSYVAADKTFCIYLATDEDAIRQAHRVQRHSVHAHHRSAADHRSADREQLKRRSDACAAPA